jgi:ABC-type amino acid transport substrate-binding protein
MLEFHGRFRIRELNRVKKKKQGGCMKTILAALATVALLASGCAAPPGASVPDDARAQLAPQGKLRVGLLAANPLFVNPGPTLGGVAVDGLDAQVDVAFAERGSTHPSRTG